MSAGQPDFCRLHTDSMILSVCNYYMSGCAGVYRQAASDGNQKAVWAAYTEEERYNMKASDLIKKYSMDQHVENGAFIEKHYEHCGPGRPDSGSIFYYVAPGETTKFHRIDCDEYWCHNAGSDIEIWSFSPDGTLSRHILGTSGDAEPFVFFRRGEVFASRLPAGSPDGTFITCITVPRFTYEGFELIEKEEMLRLYPESSAFWE